jgi:hypothetical protein
MSRKQQMLDHIDYLERQLDDATEARKRAERRATLAEAELATARAELAEAQESVYVARTDSGEVVYSGDSQGQAIAEARRHYRTTREHVVIDGSHWNTRQHGGVRRGRRV